VRTATAAGDGALLLLLLLLLARAVPPTWAPFGGGKTTFLLLTAAAAAVATHAVHLRPGDFWCWLLEKLAGAVLMLQTAHRMLRAWGVPPEAGAGRCRQIRSGSAGGRTSLTSPR